MDTETARAFEVQGATLKTIGGNVEEIKETVNGQAMAIRDVGHKRELCRAQMDHQVGEAAKAASDAHGNAELAHDRITGLKRAAWGLVIVVFVELLGIGVWIIKIAVTSVRAGGGG